MRRFLFLLIIMLCLTPMVRAEVKGYELMVGSSGMSGALYHIDVAKGLANPGTGNTLLNMGWGEIGDIELLADGNIIVGGSVPEVSGIVAYVDIDTALTDPNLGAGQQNLNLGFSDIYDLEILPDGNVIIASALDLGGAGGPGTLLHYDLAAALADANLGIGQTILNTGFGEIHDVEVLPDGNVVLGTSLDLGQGGGPGTMFHYDMPAALAGGLGSGQTTLNTGFGAIYDIEVLADSNIVLGASVVNGSIVHYDMAAALAGGVGSGQTIMDSGFQVINDIEVLADSNVVLGSTVDLPDPNLGKGTLFLYDVDASVASGGGSAAGQTVVGAGFISFYEIEQLADSNLVIGTQQASNDQGSVYNVDMTEPNMLEAFDIQADFVGKIDGIIELPDNNLVFAAAGTLYHLDTTVLDLTVLGSSYGGTIYDMVLLPTGSGLCLDVPQADFDDDCDVDFVDFAAFSVQWLDCGLDNPALCQ